MTLDLLGQLPDHVDLLGLGVALREPPHHGVHPVNSLPAGSALPTGFVFVEERQPGDGLHHVGLLVHHDDGRSAKTSLSCYQSIKIHHDVVTDLLGDKGSRGTSRNDTQEIVPASNNVTSMDLDEVLQRDAHLLLHGAGVVHVATDVKELGAAVPGATKTGKPVGSSPADSGSYGHGLHVGHCGGAAEDANISREGRLQARFTLLALQRLNQSRLLPTDVGSGPAVNEQIKVVSAAAGVLAQEPGLVSLSDGYLEVAGLVVELSSDVDISSPPVS